MKTTAGVVNVFELAGFRYLGSLGAVLGAILALLGAFLAPSGLSWEAWGP